MSQSAREVRARSDQIHATTHLRVRFFEVSRHVLLQDRYEHVSARRAIQVRIADRSRITSGGASAPTQTTAETVVHPAGFVLQKV